MIRAASRLAGLPETRHKRVDSQRSCVRLTNVMVGSSEVAADPIADSVRRQRVRAHAAVTAPLPALRGQSGARRRALWGTPDRLKIAGSERVKTPRSASGACR